MSETAVTEEDVACVARQLGREPRPFTRVVARCPAGRPVAIEQPALGPDGAPFPTSFWLTCPWLVRRIGELESAGGVARWEAAVAGSAELSASLADARSRQIALRPVLGDLGIGGTRSSTALKCLHAHVGFALGAAPYALGEAILAEAGPLPAACCSEPVEQEPAE